MAAVNWNTLSTGVLLAVVGCAVWTNIGSAEVATTSPDARAARGNHDRGTNQPWVVQRPMSSGPRKLLARLVENPDPVDGSPPYALADQTGTVQRFVEPVPGIDLEPYLGYAVIVRHDTGRTLLASQLELPGPETTLAPAAEEPTPSPLAESSPRIDAMFRDLVSSPPAGRRSEAPFPNPVQQAQFTQPTVPPVMIEENGQPPLPPGRPMMMPPGPISAPPNGAAWGGGPWGAAPSGAAPIYLDGPAGCGPQGCPTSPVAGPMWTGGPPCQPTSGTVSCAPPPPRPTRWSAWGEVLWIHPTGIDLAHAQQQNGIGGAGTVPFGNIGTLDPGYDLGFRLGGQLRFDAANAAWVRYTYFSGGAQSSLTAPDIGGGGGAVGSLVHHPGAGLTASAGLVNATYDIDFQLGDVAYRYYIAGSCRGEASVFVGARYANLDQDFAQRGVFGGGQGGTIDTSTDIDFLGVGPMAGVTGERLLGDTRFSAYGHALVAALTGEFRSRYRMHNSTTDTLLARSVWNDDRIVPMLDYELGIAWTGPRGHLRLAIGYMMSYWFNAVTTPTLIDAVQADNYTGASETIAFDGAVGHLEVRW